MNKDSILLGTGVLTWSKSERIGDRYGAVYLMVEGANSINKIVGEIPLKKIDSEKGYLIAKVIETRRSTHVGDFFRMLFPMECNVGDELKLGWGTLFYEIVKEVSGYDDFEVVGLKPDKLDLDYNVRPNDWLNPVELYKAHEQTVELYFLPDSKGSSEYDIYEKEEEEENDTEED